MPTFGGTICDFLKPTPVKAAEIESDRLTVSYDNWLVEAKSDDGFLYKGHYGEGEIDPQRTVRLWRYTGSDGSIVLYCEWEIEANPAANSESVIRLFPRETAQDGIAEIPAEWDRARAAITESQRRVVPDIPPLSLSLVADRRTGGTFNPEYLGGPGLYVLFYNSGKIARVGQAGKRTLAARLKEYEPQGDGWFVFRWVAVVPIAAEHDHWITPLEKDLISTLDPPANTMHRQRH
jgi:hypothetical protein